MATPFLAVVVPAYNEEPRIGATLESLSAHLQSKTYEWEIVVADDGSDDATARIAQEASESDSRIRLVRLEHGGKGSAMKGGMLASDAAWRFMCDADLSMPAEQIDRFLPNDGPPDYDIGVGSREVPGLQLDYAHAGISRPERHPMRIQDVPRRTCGPNFRYANSQGLGLRC